jgi:hypothetical protein
MREQQKVKGKNETKGSHSLTLATEVLLFAHLTCSESTGSTYGTDICD